MMDRSPTKVAMQDEIKAEPHDSDVDVEASIEMPIEKTATQVAMDFPDGGAKAWSVAIGAAGVMFCTFGYANAFGYELDSLAPNSRNTS